MKVSELVLGFKRMRLDKKSQKKKKARPDFAKIKIKTCFSIKFCKKLNFDDTVQLNQ